MLPDRQTLLTELWAVCFRGGSADPELGEVVLDGPDEDDDHEAAQRDAGQQPLPVPGHARQHQLVYVGIEARVLAEDEQDDEQHVDLVRAAPRRTVQQLQQGEQLPQNGGGHVRRGNELGPCIRSPEDQRKDFVTLFVLCRFPSSQHDHSIPHDNMNGLKILTYILRRTDK
jgi:hypothetical protein